MITPKDKKIFDRNLRDLREDKVYFYLGFRAVRRWSEFGQMLYRITTNG